MPVDFARVRVLIQDPSVMMGQATKDLLHFVGVKHAHMVRTEKDAMASLMLMPWDVLFTTWNTDQGNANQLVTRVRKGDFDINRYTPIVVTSSAVTPSLLQAARDAGAHEVLGKPLTGQMIKDKVGAILLRPRSFVASDEFFGPDRRRRETEYKGPDRRLGRNRAKASSGR